jgi:glycine/D-amino acid oxidase-like deaminating enzyme
MKRVLDLRTGRHVWMAYRAPRVRVSRLARDVSADVLVVGMGISGGMIAETLSAEGLDVIAIDRRAPFQGSTSASSALALYEIDVPLMDLARAMGRERAERVWKRSRLAVSNLASHIGELGISCSQATHPALLLTGNRLGAGDLREEASARRAAGLYAEYLPRAKLFARFGIERSGAILSPDNLAVDPRRLTGGLLQRAMGRGTRCYAPVEAQLIEEARGRVVVSTKDGPLVTVERVVLATGYEQLGVVPPVPHSIQSTWVIATRRQGQRLWPERAMIWEASDPYLYIRTTADGRVICGGEDEEFADETSRDALIPRKIARLSRKLAKIFPRVDPRPEFAWAGSFGTTPTGLPRIGLLPGHSNVHAVMGYGGNGFAFSRIAAEIIRADFTGGEDADAKIFAF